MKTFFLAVGFCLFSSQAFCAWSFGDPLKTDEAGWFQFVEGGCFEMGSRNPSLETKNEKPPKWVCVQSFYLGRTEVTQGLFKAIMGYNPSNNPKGDDYPVEELSYLEADAFIRKLNASYRSKLPEGWKFRMPAEAEWEYAAGFGQRGKRTLYPGTSKGSKLQLYGWIDGGDTHPVAQKKATALGLYDMAGNVAEMVSDLYQELKEKKSTGSSDQCRVVKGSAISAGEPFYARTSIRTCQDEADATSLTGFRLVIEIFE